MGPLLRLLKLAIRPALPHPSAHMEHGNRVKSEALYYVRHEVAYRESKNRTSSDLSHQLLRLRKERFCMFQTLSNVTGSVLMSSTSSWASQLNICDNASFRVRNPTFRARQ